MAYKGYKGCGPKGLGASPMKQTVAQNDARRYKIAKSRGKDLIGSDARLGKGYGVIGAINAGVKNFRENTMTPEGRSKFKKNIAKDARSSIKTIANLVPFTLDISKKNKKNK